jgi:hypothetical protein
VKTGREAEIFPAGSSKMPSTRAQDRENKIVILTGAGGEFIPEIDFSSFGNVADSGVWSQVHDEAFRSSKI